MSWEEGLKRTVDWYKAYSSNWEDVESALVAHPRRGHTGKVVTKGQVEDEKDVVRDIMDSRARTGSLSM